MSGCCGCKALLYNAYRNSQLAEQFVVETSCGLYEPTKHFFTVDSKGKVKSYKSLIAVTNNSFTLPVSELDKRAFEQIDSIYKVWTGTNKRQIMFTKISGFREGDKIHMPLGIESITNPKK